ncbi:MAG: Eco57I restriction-modification methylase domain-containing protein, partial [Candidatus Heimdallarchaeota archaeon]|nr:Eco57I restriction-modification methylase domain-containing protein [Candidatus Heimdallarchaeota archaeon]
MNADAVLMSRIRLGLNFAKTWTKSTDFSLSAHPLLFNIKTGNSLIGWAKWDEIIHSLQNHRKFNISLFRSLPSITQLHNWLQILIDPSTQDLIEGVHKIARRFPHGSSIILQLQSFYLTQSACSPLILFHLLHSLYVVLELIKKYGSGSFSQVSQKIAPLLTSIHGALNDFLIILFNKEARNGGSSDFPTSFHWIIEFPEIFPLLIPSNLPNLLPRSCNGFDLIIGNPPYGNLLTPNEKTLCQSYASSLNEISATFLERCLSLNQITGHLLFITSYVITFSKDLSQTREKLVLNYAMCKISSFDRDRCRIFSTMSQSLSFLLCLSKHPPSLLSVSTQGKILTTGMFRTMPDLYNLPFQLANDLLLGASVGESFDQKHRLPKLGNNLTVKLIHHLAILSQNVDHAFHSVGTIVNSWRIITS